MLPKRPKEIPNPADEPITANEVRNWLSEAGFKKSTDDVAESFSVIAEKWRKRNRSPGQCTFETQTEVSERTETLLSEIRTIAENLHEKIEQLRKQGFVFATSAAELQLRQLSVELRKFRAVRPMRGRGQPRALWAEMAIEFYVQLKPGLPSSSEDQSICSVIARALSRCGWNKEKKEIAKKIRQLPKQKESSGQADRDDEDC